MRCVLIIPSWVPEDIFSARTAGAQINYWQPLGTLYVASSLQQAGHEVHFLDGAFMSHRQILDEVKGLQPGFVGIYATAFGWPRAVETARDIKRMEPEVFVCGGGPYPIARQEHCLGEGEGFDAVVTGEGELTATEMVARLERGEDLVGVKGVICRQDGRIVTNPPRALIADLDELPFPNRAFLGDANLYLPPPATYKRKPVAVVLTSRGCNRRCIFCFQLDKERRSGIRYRSVENVLEEIELCLQQGFREIKFIDDTFAEDYDRAMRLAKEIKARRLDFTWFASACVNQVDRPLLRAFREAGCWAILYGAESGVQKNLNAIRKGTTLEQIRKAVRAAKDVGLTVQTSFMFGIPGETYEEALRTIDFACDIAPDLANFHAITPFPGTYLFDHFREHGTISNDLRDFTYQGAAFVPHTMTRDEISRLRHWAYRRFYSRPSYLAKKLLGLRNSEDVKIACKSTKRLFWLWAGRGLFRVPRMRNA